MSIENTRVINDTKYSYTIEFNGKDYTLPPHSEMTFPLCTAEWGLDYRYTGDVLNIRSLCESRPNNKNHFKLIEVQ